MKQQQIEKVFIEDELITSYLSYAMSVIVGRALPDVRDGLKPVHRRTLFVMKELNNKFNKQYKKSARIVGDVIGKYHPHGENAVYDSIVRMSQTFIQRYPLIDGQGNFGSVDGDAPAAMRYTEIRMAEISDYMLKDLDFATVDYIANYDNTEKYPKIFPTMFPNILINGAYGIAVGMATSIPPHNLFETINACIKHLDDNTLSNYKLNRYILGPDFPTAGSIRKTKGLHKAYHEGKGKLKIRAKAYIENNDDIPSIIIKEIPYQINKLKLITRIRHLIKNNRLKDIKLIRDESDKDGLRIYIAINHNANIERLLKKLYKLTSLENIFHINLLCLSDDLPKLLDLKKIIASFISHRREVIYRRHYFISSKLKQKIHTTESLFFTLFNTDKIIKIITTFNNIKKLKKCINKTLITTILLKQLKQYGLYIQNKTNAYHVSNVQINSIINLRLSKLIKFEKNILTNLYICLVKDYIHYTSLIKNNINTDKIIKKELKFIKKKFFDTRKTKIFKKHNEGASFSNYQTIFQKTILIILSENGYIKIQNVNDYKIQHRAGKGRAHFKYSNTDDSVMDFIITNDSQKLFCISTIGKIYILNMIDLDLSKKPSRGVSLSNFIPLANNEKINILREFQNEDSKFIVIVTEHGLIKITSITKINRLKSTGAKIINLSKDDRVIDAKIIDIKDEIMIFSNNGKVLRFNINQIKPTNRQSKGVISIKLKKYEKVISLIIPTENSFILTATKNGYGKISNINDYPTTSRKRKGVITHKITKKTGDLISAEKIFDNDNLFIITNNGIISKIKTNEIPCLKRISTGVLLIRLSNKTHLINIKRENRSLK